MDPMQLMMQMMHRCMMGGARQPEDDSTIQVLPRRGNKPKAMLVLENQENQVPARPPALPPPAEHGIAAPEVAPEAAAAVAEEEEVTGGACAAAIAPGLKRKASAIEQLDVLVAAMDGRAAEQKAKKALAKAKAAAKAKAEADAGGDASGEEAAEGVAPKTAPVPKKPAKKDGPLFKVLKMKNEVRITRDGKVVEKITHRKGKTYDTEAKAYMAAIRRAGKLRKGE